MTNRRWWGLVLVVVALVLGGVSVGPLGWGLGAVVAALVGVAGWHLLTDVPAAGSEVAQ